ncbi:hypothetical protein SH139x_005744 [Planctomycetaceae bacterium SH139]
MKPHEDVLQRRGYTVQESHGKGGQFYAYRAHEKRHGLCAVRVYRDLVDDQDQLPKSINDELLLAAKMQSSPYFATLFTSFFEDNFLFPVGDFAEPGTIAGRVC